MILPRSLHWWMFAQVPTTAIRTRTFRLASPALLASSKPCRGNRTVWYVKCFAGNSRFSGISALVALFALELQSSLIASPCSLVRWAGSAQASTQRRAPTAPVAALRLLSARARVKPAKPAPSPQPRCLRPARESRVPFAVL